MPTYLFEEFSEDFQAFYVVIFWQTFVIDEFHYSSKGNPVAEFLKFWSFTISLRTSRRLPPKINLEKDSSHMPGLWDVAPKFRYGCRCLLFEPKRYHNYFEGNILQITASLKEAVLVVNVKNTTYCRLLNEKFWAKYLEDRGPCG